MKKHCNSNQNHQFYFLQTPLTWAKLNKWTENIARTLDGRRCYGLVLEYPVKNMVFGGGFSPAKVGIIQERDSNFVAQSIWLIRICIGCDRSEDTLETKKFILFCPLSKIYYYIGMHNLEILFSWREIHMIMCTVSFFIFIMKFTLLFLFIYYNVLLSQQKCINDKQLTPKKNYIISKI